jgi:hypothetical protein
MHYLSSKKNTTAATSPSSKPIPTSIPAKNNMALAIWCASISSPYKILFGFVLRLG